MMGEREARKKKRGLGPGVGRSVRCGVVGFRKKSKSSWKGEPAESGPERRLKSPVTWQRAKGESALGNRFPAGGKRGDGECFHCGISSRRGERLFARKRGPQAAIGKR